MAAIDEYLGARVSEIEQERHSSRNAGLQRDASHATIDPRLEGSRQDSYATIGVTSLEGPKADAHAIDDKADVLPSINAFHRDKSDNEYGLFEHTSTFIPINDDGQAFEKSRPHFQ